MAEETNWQQQERSAGYKAASSLRSELRSRARQKYNRLSGAMERSTVTPRFRGGFLDRLTISSPYYSFMLHHGFSADENVKAAVRAGGTVRPHDRAGKSIGEYRRGGGPVSSYRRSASIKPGNHIAEALDASNILNTLADELSANRAAVLISQIKV